MESVAATARAIAPDRADDDDRLALAARTDADAFAALYARHRDAVYRYLRVRTPSDDEALDLTAVTFERALTAVARYRREGGGVVAWLIRIARNAAIDQQRRARSRPLQVPLREATLMRSGDDPVAAAIASEEHGRLRDLVRALPEAQRDALAMRYAVGLTAREIGDVIGKSAEATQKLLARALDQLKEAYRDER
jgi:RNA polymerase sigma-70 factor (ECF subfamily)